MLCDAGGQRTWTDVVVLLLKYGENNNLDRFKFEIINIENQQTLSHMNTYKLTIFHLVDL